MKEKKRKAIIGEEEIRQAAATLKKYQAAKRTLDERVSENEEWFRLRHWQQIRRGDEKNLKHSAWLFNSIINKHADCMDSLPECTVLPREESDIPASEMLTGILPVILDRNRWHKVYSDASYAKLKTGTAVYSVLWNSEAEGGLGEIDIKNTDILKIFWEPGIKDIQKSRNIFYVDSIDNDILIENYPFLEGRLGSSGELKSCLSFDKSVDLSEKSPVVDWYYKKKSGGRTLVHFCKFTGDNLLYSSENDPLYEDSGWYDHGKYPFVFDTLFSEEGTPVGFGYIDVMKEAQEEIDILDNELIKNARMAAKRRYFTRVEGAVNEEEFADFNKDFVHVSGSSLGEDSIREISHTPLSGIYVTILNNKINELKETSGNRDFSQGGTAGGVTSGTAIAALQEAGNKLSRDMINSTYFAFSEVCLLIIELIRQFYTVPRSMRITGKDGGFSYRIYDNSAIKNISQGNDFGFDMGLRDPLFDVKIKAHRQNAFSRAAQNQDALNFYSMGFFDPAKAKQSLACLEVLDMENKDRLMNIISENGKKAEEVTE